MCAYVFTSDTNEIETLCFSECRNVRLWLNSRARASSLDGARALSIYKLCIFVSFPTFNWAYHEWSIHILTTCTIHDFKFISCSHNLTFLASTFPFTTFIMLAFQPQAAIRTQESWESSQGLGVSPLAQKDGPDSRNGKYFGTLGIHLPPQGPMSSRSYPSFLDASTN